MKKEINLKWVAFTIRVIITILNAVLEKIETRSVTVGEEISKNQDPKAVADATLTKISGLTDGTIC